MKVAVTQREIVLGKNPKQYYDAIDRNFYRFFKECGLEPRYVPNTLQTMTDGEVWWDKHQVQGVFLTGGDDLGNNPSRDLTEDILLRVAKARNQKVFGICRGMQLMSKLAGGTLKKIPNHVNKLRQVTLHGEVHRIMCFHRFALNEIPDGFTLISKTSDGCIEAIKSNDDRQLGVMWHPERMCKFEKLDIKLVKEHFGCVG